MIDIEAWLRELDEEEDIDIKNNEEYQTKLFEEYILRSTNHAEERKKLNTRYQNGEPVMGEHGLRKELAAFDLSYFGRAYLPHYFIRKSPHFHIIGFEALFESMQKCKKGVMWKGSAAHYVLNGLEETLKLEKQLKTGTYKARQTTKFRVTYPKPRDIVSICFRDRVYQRSLNDNAIYPAMTKSFIQHNCACQKDKGTDYARAVLDEFLHRHYRKYGRAGGVLQVDVHGYYPNMKHQVAKDKFKKHLEPDIYKRAEAVLEDQYEGDVGYNPGSQMIQIAGISVLDELDHFIKEQLGIKRYLRYMDDFLLMHEDLEYLEYCKDKVIEKLAEYGFEPNPKKTKVIPITEEILFLGFYYRLTETGKIIMRLNPANVKQERKKLYRLVAKAKKGELSKAKVDECFNGWKDHAAKGTSYQLLRRMEAYYKELWRNQDGISTDQNKRL